MTKSKLMSKINERLRWKSSAQSFDTMTGSGLVDNGPIGHQTNKSRRQLLIEPQESSIDHMTTAATDTRRHSTSHNLEHLVANNQRSRRHRRVEEATTLSSFDNNNTMPIWDQNRRTQIDNSSTTSVISARHEACRDSFKMMTPSCHSKHESAATGACKTDRGRRKGEISNFLMILFSAISLLLLTCATNNSCLSINQSSANSLRRALVAINSTAPTSPTTVLPLSATVATEVKANYANISALISGGVANVGDSSNSSRQAAVSKPNSDLGKQDAIATTTRSSVEVDITPSSPSDVKDEDEGSDSSNSDSEAAAEAEDASSSNSDDNALATSDSGEVEGKKLAKSIFDGADGIVDVLINRMRNDNAPSQPNDDDDDNENDGTKNAAEEPAKNPTESDSTTTSSQGDNVSNKSGDSPSNRRQSGEQLAAERLVASHHQLVTRNATSASATSQSKEQLEDARHMKLAMETYDRWRATGDDLIELFSRKMLPLIVEHGYDVDATTVSGLLQIFNGIRSLKPWALKLLDASAKITPGLLVGTQSDFGDYDECLNIRVDDPSGFEAANSDFPVDIDPQTGLKSTTLVGKYCLADVEFPKPPRERRQNYSHELQTQWAPIELRRPLFNFSQSPAYKDTIFVETANFFHMLYVDPIRVAFCLTNKIDENNFARVFNKLFEEFRVTIDFRGRCVTKYDKLQWSLQQQISAYLLLIICSLVCASTVLDLLHLKLAKIPTFGAGMRMRRVQIEMQCKLYRYRPLFTSFSIIRNTKRLFRSQQSAFGTCSTTTNGSDYAAAFTKPSYLPDQQHQQFKLNLSQVLDNTNDHDMKSSVSKLANLISASPPASSSAESSVESSPCIERRCSSSTDGSALNLIVSGAEHRDRKSYDVGLGKIGRNKLDSNCNSINNNNKPMLMLRMKHQHSNHASSMMQQSSTGDGPSSSSAAGINLLSLHGIRVITMTWMIVNHTYLFGGFFVLWAHRRLIDIADWPKSVSFQLVLNGWLTVETYFFLSAMIIVLNLMPLMKGRKFNYATYIIHRLIRLMPAYLGLVALNFLWPLISSGPVWLVKGRSFIQTPCENYLWTNFLFINNWIWPEKQCMVHTWFLSADFQLYLFAPIIVYLLYRRPALGHSVNLIVAVVASIVSGLVIYANKLLPTTLINKLEFDSIKQQLSYSYFATYQHMGPYCLGILTGYLLHKRPNVKLPKHLSWFLWLLLPPLSFTTLLLTYLWNGAYEDADLINPSPLVSALYVAIHRTIWTSLLAWVVFACATGRAKLLANFLSHSMFIPLSRLSFSIYLVHLPVIMFRALNLRHTIEWTDSNILWESCGNFVFSLIMAYFLNIAFESPMINLESYLFGKRDQRRQDLHATDYIKTTAGSGAQSNRTSSMASDHVANMFDEPVASRQTASNENSISSGQHSADELSCDNKSCGADTTTTTSGGGCSKPEAPATASTSLSQSQSSQQHVHLSRDSSLSIKGSRTGKSSLIEDCIEQQFKSHEQQQQRRPFRQSNRRAGSLSQASSLDANYYQQQQQQQPSLSDTENRSLNGFGRSTGVDYAASNGPSRMRLSEATNAMSVLDMMQSRVLSSRRRQAHQTNGDDIYNIAAEYQHYAPGSYQRWRLNGASNNKALSVNYAGDRLPFAARPTQYATLARSHRLQSGDITRHINRHQSMMLNELDELAVGGAEADVNATGSQSLDVIEQAQNNRHTRTRNMLASASNMQSRPVMSHRQTRYNTLTGTGSRDWRLKYSAAASRQDQDNKRQYHWPRSASIVDYPSDQQYDTSMASDQTRWSMYRTTSTSNGAAAAAEPESYDQASWLQPGALIPRIDSSTLRRQQARRAPETTETSIIEEPAHEDDVSSAL